jgi:predicted Rossmann fold flavoprotein
MTAAASLKDVRLSIDLIPEVSTGDLETLLANRSGDGGRRKVASIFSQWLPSRLVDALATQSGGNLPIAQLPGRVMQSWIENTKRLHLPVNGTRGFAKAEVTAGGVSLKEVDPRTMASRIVDDLFIAGEVLDVDGWIGGYNFQAAFATGRSAAIGATANSAKTD